MLLYKKLLLMTFGTSLVLPLGGTDLFGLNGNQITDITNCPSKREFYEFLFLSIGLLRRKFLMVVVLRT